MKADVTDQIKLTPGPCCGARDSEYSINGTRSKRALAPGQLTEVWVHLRRTHCHRIIKIIGFCKLAGDGDATGRQRNYRRNIERKVVQPSTPVTVTIG